MSCSCCSCCSCCFFCCCWWLLLLLLLLLFIASMSCPARHFAQFEYLGTSMSGTMAEMGLPSMLRRRGEQRSPETPRSPRWHHDYADVSEKKMDHFWTFLDLVQHNLDSFVYASSVLMVWRGVERVAERDIIAICRAHLN